MPKQQTLIWKIEPLPDFLLDHTLTEESWPGRMREVITRWIQVVGSLWSWQDQASFALRYTSDGDRVRAFFIAQTRGESEGKVLEDDVTVLLRSCGLPVLPSHNYLSEDSDSAMWDLGGGAISAEVRQHQNNRLWPIPNRILSNAAFKEKYDWVPDKYLRNTPHLFPWWAPGGPFLVPIEKLVSQPVPCSLTATIMPTRLTRQEWEWLSFVARTAHSVGDVQEQAIDQAMAQRKIDPAATLAGRLAMANLRRLSDKPYLVSVRCSVGGLALSSLRSLTSTTEAIVYESPIDLNSSDEERLPSAADVIDIPAAFEIPDEDPWVPFNDDQSARSIDSDDPLSRLPYLVDARGASTFFRLPLNVRGGIPGFKVAQRPPDFHPGPRLRDVPQDHVLLGELHQGGVATVPKNDFVKHALITGFTGSGKTVTMLGLTHQLHALGVPVLVLESAKHEYRGLLNVPDFVTGETPLWIFTAGNESCAPLRINPFEVLPGIRVEAHISRLQTCFEAALPPIGPLASLIGEALVDIYEQLGWRLTDVGPDIGEILSMRFPSMADFYTRMSTLIGERGYEGEVRSNVTAAVVGRIRPLTTGTKGLMLRSDVESRVGEPRRKSLVSQLFSRSTVIEMNDLNIEDKALVTMFILTFLREYREKHCSHDGTLVHAAIVEEAHNVLENVPSTGGGEGGGADTRFKAVQTFSQLLTEIRALGQGLMIVDQSPEKLAPDALRNTNIQIAHQLRDARDRESVARAMIMEPEQQDYLGKLRPGQAAVFMTGLERATFVQVPRYRGLPHNRQSERDRNEDGPAFDLSPPTDQTVKDHMTPVTSSYRSGPFDVACSYCPVRLTCDYRKPVVAALPSTGYPEQFAAVAENYRCNRQTDRRETVQKLVQISVEVASRADAQLDEASTWCSFVHLWHRDRFNWTERFPTFSYDTFRNILQTQHPDVLRTNDKVKGTYYG